MNEDEIVADVRRIREELAARFEFDTKKIFADLRTRQAGRRVVSPPPPSGPVGGIPFPQQSSGTGDAPFVR